jgi:hypothetical protein
MYNKPAGRSTPAFGATHNNNNNFSHTDCHNNPPANFIKTNTLEIKRGGPDALGEKQNSFLPGIETRSFRYLICGLHSKKRKGNFAEAPGTSPLTQCEDTSRVKQYNSIGIHFLITLYIDADLTSIFPTVFQQGLIIVKSIMLFFSISRWNKHRQHGRLSRCMSYLTTSIAKSK